MAALLAKIGVLALKTLAKPLSSRFQVYVMAHPVARSYAIAASQVRGQCMRCTGTRARFRDSCMSCGIACTCNRDDHACNTAGAVLCLATGATGSP